MLEDKEQKPRLHYFQFGSGYVYSTPVAGNPVKVSLWRRLVNLLLRRPYPYKKLKLKEVSVKIPNATIKIEKNKDGTIIRVSPEELHKLLLSSKGSDDKKLPGC